MTALIARSPLQILSMASTQRPTTTTARRRSARHAFDAEDQNEGAPAVKRAKTNRTAAEDAGRQAQVQTNGTANGSARGGGSVAVGRKTRAVAYDEDDDGFTFSRTRSKKTTQKKAAPAVAAEEPVPVPAPAPAAAETKAAAAAKSKKRTKKSLAAIAPAAADEVAPKRRRSARLSGEHQQDQQQQREPASTPAPEKPKRVRKTAANKEKTPKNKDEETLALIEDEAQVEQPSREGTKISLPFADTPVISRNKEMRKGGGSGHRRSSTGLRGRRASSLIDSGTSNAVPHAEVPTEDFYKLIEQGLPEPRRMKQLLTWCGTRALPEKPSGEVEDSNAIMAARAIQQELLNDFASKSEMSNWFDREDLEPAVLVKKPNPRNLQNAAKLEELEREVKRLQEEKRAWESLLKTPSSISASPKAPDEDKEALPDAAPPPPDSALDIDPALLDDPEQARILASLTGLSLASSAVTSTTTDGPNANPSTTAMTTAATATTATATTTTTTTPAMPPPSSITQAQAPQLDARLRALTASLEPQIDLFADGVHKVAQLRGAAERVADRVLGAAARRLEGRDRAGRESAGTAAVGAGDVLRALGSVLGGGKR